MEQLNQTHTNIDDLFARLSAERAALDNAMQRCAKREVQDRELLSAVGEFAERQQRVEDDMRALLDRQRESDEVMEESITRMFREKREKDEGIRMEIEGLFGASVHGAQEILRRFDITTTSADEFVNLATVRSTSVSKRPRLVSISSVSSPSSSLSGLSNPFANSLASPTLQSAESLDNEFVSLTPLNTPKWPSSSISPNPPDITETKLEPREWDFLDYEQGVAWGSGGKPRVKPPTSFTEFNCDFEEATPTNRLPLEPVDNTVIIPITEWHAGTADSTRNIKVNGVRVLKSGILELSVKVLDDQTALEPGALEELTYSLTKYHRGTQHKLAGKFRQWAFVSVQSSHGTAWHRGLILEIIGRDAEVLFIDSGFHESVRVDNLRPLPTLFRFLPQQARKARLSFVKLPDAQSQHHAEALEVLQETCMGRMLAAKLDYGGDNRMYCMNSVMVPVPPSLMHLRLMEPGVDSDDIPMSVNGQLLREGLATIDSELGGSIRTYQSTPRLLAKAAMKARNEGLGMYRREEALSR
ncbi:hypothetical protein EWM64_g3766 [Hericium alpestre]|uniref:Tudor domain-containing protein n=1 Tax=Hericium alpestre TaxID=135208 RepID=A0A4Y9ZZD3_9AGAM|nr:hypothetical protein EWM64_g3766 [Hericium alpestre]